MFFLFRDHSDVLLFMKHTSFFFLFRIPYIISPFFFYISLLVVTQIRDHVAGSSPVLIIEYFVIFSFFFFSHLWTRQASTLK